VLGVFETASDGRANLRAEPAQYGRPDPDLTGLRWRQRIGSRDDLAHSAVEARSQRAGKGSPEVRDVLWTDSDLAVSPNGELVAFVSGRNGPEQIWVSKLDGAEPRVLVPAIPPYGDYGDNTNAGDLSWSPDGQWIAFLTNPGVGHGDSESRLFLTPSAGGPLRVLVELCALVAARFHGRPDSKSVFVAREDDSDGKENFEMKYFQVDILSGKQTAVSEHSLPAWPMERAPSGSENAHLAEGGRFLYFERREDLKSRIVVIHDLLGGK